MTTSEVSTTWSPVTAKSTGTATTLMVITPQGGFECLLGAGDARLIQAVLHGQQKIHNIERETVYFMFVHGPAEIGVCARHIPSGLTGYVWLTPAQAAQLTRELAATSGR